MTINATDYCLNAGIEQTDVASVIEHAAKLLQAEPTEKEAKTRALLGVSRPEMCLMLAIAGHQFWVACNRQAA